MFQFFTIRQHSWFANKASTEHTHKYDDASERTRDPWLMPNFWLQKRFCGCVKRILIIIWQLAIASSRNLTEAVVVFFYNFFSLPILMMLHSFWIRHIFFQPLFNWENLPKPEKCGKKLIIYAVRFWRKFTPHRVNKILFSHFIRNCSN